MVAGAAGHDPALRIAIPEGHRLKEVRQLAARTRVPREKRTRCQDARGAPAQPPREGREREYRSNREPKAETEAEGKWDKTGKEHQKANFH